MLNIMWLPLAHISSRVNHRSITILPALGLHDERLNWAEWCVIPRQLIRTIMKLFCPKVLLLLLIA